MPFMKGVAPVRRTKEYLEAGKLFFRPEIRVMTVNYNLDQKASKGAYEFLFWHLPQIRFKNPGLQLLKFKNLTPTPCMQLFFLDGRKQVVDLYDKSRVEIHDHLLDTFCLEQEKDTKGQWSKANFGYGCNRWCICEVPGQVPCPGYVELPAKMRGKYQKLMKKKD